MNLNINKESLLYSLFTFLKRPQYNPVEKRNFFVKLIEMLRLYSFSVIFILGAGILLSILLSLAGFQDSDNAVVSLIQNESIFVVLILAVIYAPISEELAFRLGLKPSRWRISISLALMVNIAITILNPNLFTDLSISLLVSVVLIVITYLLLRLVKKEQVENIFAKQFGKIFYITVILFGAIHISNYTNLSNAWIILPFLFLPQIFAGIAFGYARVKYGFFFAILLHMLHNFVTLTPILLIMSGVDFSNPELAENLDIGSSVGILVMCCVFTFIFLTGFLMNIYNLIELFRRPKVQ